MKEELIRIKLPEGQLGRDDLEELSKVWARINQFLALYTKWRGQPVKVYPVSLEEGSSVLGCLVSAACLPLLEQMENDIGSGAISTAPKKIRDSLRKSMDATRRFGGYQLFGRDPNTEPIVDLRREREIQTEPLNNFKSYGLIVGRAKELILINDKIKIIELWTGAEVTVQFEDYHIFANVISGIGESRSQGEEVFNLEFEGAIEYNGDSLIPEKVIANAVRVVDAVGKARDLLPLLNGKVDTHGLSSEDYVREIRSGQ